MGAAVIREPGGLPYDYAVAVEDVELQNEAGAAETERHPDEGIACILDHLKLGVDAVLQEKNQEQDVPVLPKGKAKRALSIATDAERRRFLRERCSFHLLRPMVEALFFGEPAAVLRAAGPGVTLPPVRFDPGACDIERFETRDEGYLEVADDATRSISFRPWRRRHPKLYLQYLLASSGSFYKETEHGKRALATLDWQTVVAPPCHAQMVRALLDDLADMLGVTLPSCAAGPCHPLTQRRSGGYLRNIA